VRHGDKSGKHRVPRKQLLCFIQRAAKCNTFIDPGDIEQGPALGKEGKSSVLHGLLRHGSCLFACDQPFLLDKGVEVADARRVPRQHIKVVRIAGDVFKISKRIIFGREGQSNGRCVCPRGESVTGGISSFDSRLLSCNQQQRIFVSCKENMIPANVFNSS
jgi:hypothetical protein